jgi:hypothetical protein
VKRWLASHPAWLERLPTIQKAHGHREGPALWTGPAPSHSNLPPPEELGEMFRIVSKLDVVSRDARNRTLGRAGEERILRHEQSVLQAAGRSDLADVVGRCAPRHDAGLLQPCLEAAAGPGGQPENAIGLPSVLLCTPVRFRRGICLPAERYPRVPLPSSPAPRAACWQTRIL